MCKTIQGTTLKLSIKARLTILCVFLTSITSLILSISITRTAIDDASTALEKSAQERLVGLRDTTATNIESYFSTIEDQIITYSSNLMIVDALTEFIPAFNLAVRNNDIPSQQIHNSLQGYYRDHYDKQFRQLNDGESAGISELLLDISPGAKAMQYTYISNNASKLGEKDHLVSANTGTEYDRLHAKYHLPIRKFLQQFGYYDIFLVDADSGNIVYSVFKELDFGTSLKTGPYANHGIGLAFKRALSAKQADETFLTDFSPYLPSYNAPASFISSPIFKAGKLAGVLIFQMPVDRINNVMTHRQRWQETGLGESGETYLVGDDFNMRSDGRFLIEDKTSYLQLMQSIGLSEKIITQLDKKETSIGLQPVRTQGTAKALAGEEGFSIFADYRGIPVLSAYKPLNIAGLNWAIMSEIDKEEAFKEVDSLVKSIIYRTIATALVAVVVGAFLGWVIARLITRPIEQMAEVMSELAKGQGDLTQRVPVKGDDELARLGHQFNRFIQHLDGTFSSLRASVVRLVPIAEDQGEVIRSLTESIADQKQQTDNVNVSLNDTNQASELVSKQLQEVNEATQKGNNTVRASSQVVGEASDQIGNLVANMDTAVGALDELQSETSRIELVVDVINSIAEQTNLLALNAAIEAARAGEAGRGFAVVADEVRSLASKTRQSTEEVSEMVLAIQKSTSSVFESMEMGKENAEVSSSRMKNATQELYMLHDAMDLITRNVEGISGAVNTQKENFASVNHQYERLNESFSRAQDSTIEATEVGADITKMGAKLFDMVSAFKVTDDDISTSRRKLKRH
jgi:methyl-accepting chemotaxis protein